MAGIQKHKIVALDSWVKPPQFSFDYDEQRYSKTTPEELPERMKDATIVITSATPITRAGIESAPDLQLVACNGTGTDHIDKKAIRERGLTLCRVPAQNTDSVTEHAFALYYTARRHIVEMHNIAMDGTIWPVDNALAFRLGKPPRTNSEETLVVFGYGALGKNVERLGNAMGMKVVIAERKDASVIREGRTAFEDAISHGTVFILVTPLDDSTRNMISTAELEKMDSTALLINVGRGGVVNEAALAKALREKQIAGAGTDVFEHEPATKDNCPLLDPSIPNLIVSPHVAWYSSKTIKGTVATVHSNIEGFVAGRPQNTVILNGKD